MVKKSVSISSGNGGKRPGAGRKPGSHNKKTEALIKAVEETGITPLEFMLSVMREPLPVPPDVKDGVEQYVAVVQARDKAKAIALDAAFKAAPFCHAKLQAIEVTGKDGQDLAVMNVFNMAQLRGLTPDELSTFKDLLDKLGKSNKA